MPVILDKNGAPLRFLEHTTSDPLQQFYQSFDAGRKRLMDLPVCPKCERTGFRDKGWKDRKSMICPHCGYTGPTQYQLAAYMKDEAYK